MYISSYRHAAFHTLQHLGTSLATECSMIGTINQEATMRNLGYWTRAIGSQFMVWIGGENEWRIEAHLREIRAGQWLLFQTANYGTIVLNRHLDAALIEVL